MSPVTERLNRQTRTWIAVIDNRDGSFDCGDYPWATLCTNHGNYVTHPTRRLAERHAADPAGWCETCRSNLEAQQRTMSGAGEP